MPAELITALPPGGLDNSLLVAILVGLLVLHACTETFGWSFVGLVVPGYLASVFVVYPEAGAVVVFEAIVAHGLVRGLSRLVGDTDACGPFFGRERFFLIILVSVFVRQHSEVWLLPAVTPWLDAQLGTSFALERGFFSIGYVLVPIATNMFWRPGLRRGLIQVGVPVVLTYLILNFVLLPYTNLSYTSIELIYENLALDFLASPKVYIILLVGALLGARFNVRFGWDFHGILIPALLALTWFTPLKLAATLVEALVLAAAVRLVLLLPYLRTANLEGPRKIVLVFALGFGLKYATGWMVALYLPDVHLMEWLGFGYLLTSLLAEKMLQRRSVGQVLLPSVLTSLAAFVLGSAIGFGLDRVVPGPARGLEPVATVPAPTRLLGRQAAGVLAAARVRAYAPRLPEGSTLRRLHAAPSYGRLWRAVAAWMNGSAAPPPQTLQPHAAGLGLELAALADPLAGRPAWRLWERNERPEHRFGWDTAVIVPGAPGPVLLVPLPWSEAAAADAAPGLCARVACRAIVAAGVDEADPSGAGRAPAASALSWVYEALQGLPLVELRADPRQAVDLAVLHVPQVLHPALDVNRLWPAGAVLTGAPAPGPLPGSLNPPAWAVLRAHPLAWQRDSTRGAAADFVTAADVDLPTWLARRRRALPPVSETPYAPPSVTELRFIEEDLAGALLAAAANPADRERFRVVAARARLVGWALHWLPDGAGRGAGCWVLAEAPLPLRHGWGLLAVRDGAAAPVAVEVPRPRRERHTGRLGVELWLASGARALVQAEAERAPNADGDPDPAIPGNLATPFQALHQAVHRALAGEHDAFIGQIRALGDNRGVSDPLVVAVGRPLLSPAERPPGLDRWLAPDGALGPLAGAVRYHDGAADLVGLSGSGNPQIEYGAAVGGPPTGLFWFSASVRARFVGHAPRLFERMVADAGLDPAPLPLPRLLLEPPLQAPAGPCPAGLRQRFDDTLDRVLRYRRSHNIHVLRDLLPAASTTPPALGNPVLQAGFCEAIEQTFVYVAVQQGEAVLRGIVLLTDDAPAERRLEAGAGVEARIRAALFERSGIIAVHGRAEAAP